MKIYDYIKSSTWGVLESDLTPDEKVKKIIYTFSAVCAATATQPIPFADIFILTPMQAYMGTLIAKVRGYNFSMQQVYKEIIGVMALGFFAQQTAIGLYKFIPVWGIFTTIPIVYLEGTNKYPIARARALLGSVSRQCPPTGGPSY